MCRTFMSMNKPRFLKLLIAVTTIALIGIIGLQLYWLNSFYSGQVSRFRQEAKSAIGATLIRYAILDKMGLDSLVTRALSEEIDSSKMAPMVWAQLREQTKDKIESSLMALSEKILTPDSGLLNIPQEVLKRFDSTENDDDKLEYNHNKNAALEIIVSNKNNTLNLKQLQKYFREECAKRSIEVPKSIALVDTSVGFDTTSAGSIEYNIPVQYKDGNKKILQIRFSDLNIAALKEMRSLLLVSALLILLVCISFTYMVQLFFRTQRAAKERVNFVNNLAHELKTPISSASLAIQLSEEGAKKNDGTNYGSIALGELNRMALLVDKMLTMAAFEKQEIKVCKEQFEVKEWMEEVLTSFKPILEKRNIQVGYDVVPASLSLTADRNLMTIALQNLIDNAIKYNDHPHPSINIEALKKDGDIVRIVVSDNGTPIPMYYQKKIFEQYFRIPKGDKHDVKGHGIGLSFTLAVIKHHGGTLVLKSPKQFVVEIKQ